MGLHQDQERDVWSPPGRHSGAGEQFVGTTTIRQGVLSVPTHAGTVASHVAGHHLLPCRQQLLA